MNLFAENEVPAENSADAAAEAPKRRRASRRATAPTTDTAAAVAATAASEAPADAPATAQETGAGEGAAEAPKRRTRRTTKAVESADNNADSASEPAAEEKPKRRSRRATTATVNTAEAAEAAEAQKSADTVNSPAGENGDTAEAEAPKTRARRTRAKKADENANAESADAGASDDAEGADGEQKPKRRRTTKKSADAQKSDDAAIASTEGGEAADSATEEKPKRGRRKKATEKTESGEAQAANAEDKDSEGGKNEDETSGKAGKGSKNQKKNQRGKKAADADKNDSDGENTDDNSGESKDDSESSKNQKNQKGSTRSRTRQRDRKRRGNDDDDPQLTEDDVLLPVAGILDVLDNYAFVRTTGYLPGQTDIYVSLSQVKRHELRKGDAIAGQIRQPREGENNGRQKYNALVKIDSVNGQTVEEAKKRGTFEELTAVSPSNTVRLSTGSESANLRAIDLLAPVALGQRGLIVGAPGSGLTTLVTEMATAFTRNHPEVHVMTVLVGARPEEVTELTRTVDGEVITAPADASADDQATVLELALERAKRLVELGHDVALFVDSLSDVANALDTLTPRQQRTLMGPDDASIINVLKRLFSVARNVENGGSLSIYAGASLFSNLSDQLKAVQNWYVELTPDFAAAGIEPVIDPSTANVRGANELVSAAHSAATGSLRKAVVRASHGLADTDGSDPVEKARNIIAEANDIEGALAQIAKQFG